MACACAARVAALEAACTALRERVVVLERQVRVRVEDEVAWMRALVGSVGACVFSARELRAHSRVDPALRAVLRDRTAKQVGKQLRALADRPIAGVVLRRVMRDEHGVVWGLQVRDDLQAGAVRGEDAG